MLRGSVSRAASDTAAVPPVTGVVEPGVTEPGATAACVGDEDGWCLDSSVFIKRTAPTAGLLVIPRSGHTITSEEPAAFNAACADLFAAAEAGRWMAHKPKN